MPAFFAYPRNRPERISWKKGFPKKPANGGSAERASFDILGGCLLALDSPIGAFKKGANNRTAELQITLKKMGRQFQTEGPISDLDPKQFSF
jgi:hypothetical protein